MHRRPARRGGRHLRTARDSIVRRHPVPRVRRAQRVTAIAVVPARGGSKGIPRKNVKSLAGRPLIAWTIAAALEARRFERVVVSTDDEEIAEIARGAGASVPFLRPAALARDDTPGIDPVLHALEQLPGFDEVAMLQPTSPLRTAADIAACIDFARARVAPAVVSVAPPRTHPYWTYTLSPTNQLEPIVPAAASTARRQELPAVHALNGAIYYAQTAWLRRERTFIGPGTLGFVMSPEHSIDIDSPLDWRIAELLLQAPA